MADYDLSRLSSRSFEQLIQALATKVIGPGVVPFGDGPDGGRDAVFEGKFNYPSPADGWDGYGVIQAKFLQRPRNAKHDGDWVIDQLVGELEKYCDHESKRRMPEYYVLATNVSLTAVADRGSLDRVVSVFKDYQTRMALKGFDIWDYNKIRAFLDNNEDVRTSNAAWITPGDVLAKIIQTLSLNTPDFEDTLVNFLQKEMLNDEFVNLEQAGHDANERIPLASVFVDLPIHDEKRDFSESAIAVADVVLEQRQSASITDKGIIKEILEVSSEHLDPQSLSIQRARQNSDAVTSERSRGRYVLIGGPGQGKTTIGQFICQIFRASIVESRPQYTLSEEVQRALQVIRDNCHSENISLSLVPRFPFRIVLNEFASALSSSTQMEVNSVLSFLVEQISKRTDRRISADELREWMAKYPCVFIFDGLDEVPSSNGRDQVLDSIRDFWVDARECNADILSIATSRPQGYNHDFSPTFYQHMTLAPLSDELGMHFAKRLVEVRYGADLDRKNKVLDRLQRAFESESTSRLMRSPLQITIMTALVDRMGQPPEARWNLFRAYYEVIYQREVERNIPTSELLRQFEPDINAIHSRVGLLLQIDTERRGRTEARFSAQRFIALVEERLKEEGHSGKELEVLTKRIVEAASQRLVFLVGLESDRVGFEIRSLQEFMAAECLMEGGDKDIQMRLREIAPIPNWRNVFLFAAGKCFAERQHLRETVHAICGLLNEKSGDGVAGTYLAGSGLAMDLLEEGLTRHQPRYAEGLARIATRALDIPNDSYHRQLARIYEPQLAQIYIDELTRRLNDSRECVQIGAWDCLLWLVQAQIQWANELAEHYWPAERHMQLSILNQARDLADNQWVTEKILELMPHASVPQMLDLLRFRSSLSHLADLDLLPEQKGMLKVLELDDSDLIAEITMFQSSFMRHTIIPTFSDGGNWLYLFSEMDDCDPTWNVFRIAAEFLMDPSKESLAAALREIAYSVGAEFFQQESNWFARVPWPISASLIPCSDTSDILHMSQRALSGALGDSRDWAAAEKRWLETGITEEDFLSMSHDRLPFDSKISVSGFPITMPAFAHVWYRLEAADQLDSLLRIYNQMGKGRSRSFMAEMIIVCLFHAHFAHVRRESSEGPITGTMNLGKLREIFGDLKPESRIPFEVVVSQLQHSNQEIVEFFTDLALRKIRFLVVGLGQSYYSDGINRLVEAFESSPGGNELLPVIGLLAEQGLLGEFTIKIPELESLDNPDHRIDAFIILLSQQSWKFDNTEKLAGFAREVCEISDTSHQRVFNTLLLNRSNGNYLDKFLLEFGRILQDGDYESQTKFMSLLENSLRRRISRFADPDECEQFNMPRGITALLRT